MLAMENIDSFKERIIREYDRLDLDSKFRFGCNPEVPCFGKCCANVNIFLTPYDVLRMRKRLGITSSEFLRKYAVPIVLEENQLPVVLLKMGEDEEKKCPFVTDEGCTIYEDRPWSCRMYPLGIASSAMKDGEAEVFCYIVDPDDTFCKGFKEQKEWTVKEWLDDQDVGTFNKKSESYMQFTLHPYLREKKELGEKKAQVFFKTCYDIDGFREMLLESSFLNKFEVDNELLEKMKTDDEALLEFGINKWLRFALFHEDTMIIRDEALEDGVRALGWKVEEVKEEDI